MSEETRTTCPFCSLHCADLRLIFDGGRLVRFYPACPLGETGYQYIGRFQTSRRVSKKTIQNTQTWLEQAKLPMIVLSGGVEQEAVIAAVRLARKYSAVLTCDEDFTGTYLGLAMQTAGFLTGTLGTLRAQSLTVLCGVEPSRTHPRLVEFLSPDLHNQVVNILLSDPLEWVRWMRLAGSGAKIVVPPVYAETASRINTAKSGVLLFGPEWIGPSQPLASELLLWLRDLNRKQRWFVLYLPPAANSTGVVEALLAETGYAGNIRFRGDLPEYSPHLWQTDRLIQQGLVDLVIWVGQPAPINSRTMAKLSKTRTILLDPRKPGWKPQIWLPVAQAGVDTPGKMLRLDAVPVDLKPIYAVHLPTHAEILMGLI